MKTILFPVCYVIIIVGLITYGGYHCNYTEKDKPENDIKKEITQKLYKEIEPKEVFESSYINLAFLGLDKTKRREKTIGCFRTDTIIIMHIDLENRKVHMLSIPRDSYVFIPVINRMDKINHAFPYGGGEKGKGFESTISTVEDFLGVKVDHYIGMDMEAIEPVVDAVGGIKLDVDLDYHENECHLIKGKTQILSGKMAYHYVHFRYTSRGDIDRIERQQKFLKAFLKMAHNSITIDKGIQLYAQIRPMVHTDMTHSQILSLIYYFKTLNPSDIDSSFIDGNFMNLNGISYWKPDMEQKQTRVDNIFSER